MVDCSGRGYVGGDWWDNGTWGKEGRKGIRLNNNEVMIDDMVYGVL
jgi:hypothetical protein